MIFAAIYLLVFVGMGGCFLYWLVRLGRPKPFGSSRREDNATDATWLLMNQAHASSVVPTPTSGDQGVSSHHHHTPDCGHAPAAPCDTSSSSVDSGTCGCGDSGGSNP